MEITYIKLKRIRDQQKLVAVTDVTIDDLIVIHGIKVLLNKDNRLFISMPGKKNPNGTFSDVVHPISGSGRSIFEKLIFPATEKMIKEKRNSLQYKITQENKRAIIDQSLNDFTIVEDDCMHFIDESVRDEILSWLNH